MTTEQFTELDARRLGHIRRYFVRHPLAMDWLVAGIVAVPGIASELGFHYTVGSVCALLGGAALMWRRHHPLIVTSVLLVLSIVSLLAAQDAQFGFALMFGLYCVAAARPPRVSWLAFIVVVGVNCPLIYYLLSEPVVGHPLSALEEQDRWFSIIGIFTCCLAAIAIGISVRSRRLHIATLIERANSLARDQEQQALIAAGAERARIAREMHDVVAHSLTVMVALADGAKAAAAMDPELANQALTELSTTGRTALRDMRQVLGVLRDADAVDAAPLEPADVATQIGDLVERFRTAGLPVRYVQGDTGTLPAGVNVAVSRIVQESLTNVLRYARLTPAVVVEVTGARTPGVVDVTVSNQSGPVGHHTPVGTGRGIIGMRERAAMYGGTLDAGPTATGWAVHATLRVDGNGNPDGRPPGTTQPGSGQPAGNGS